VNAEMPRPSADPGLDVVDLRTLMSHGASRLLRAAATRLFGFDYFVSYARHDAPAYAERLARALEAHGYYTCFDRTDLLPDDDLDESLRRAARRSRYTVLVDTVGARMSKYVADDELVPAPRLERDPRRHLRPCLPRGRRPLLLRRVVAPPLPHQLRLRDERRPEPVPA
jgi:hypothetical protein